MRREANDKILKSLREFAQEYNKRMEDPFEYLVAKTEKDCLKLMRKWGGGVRWPFQLPDNPDSLPSHVRYLLRYSRKALTRLASIAERSEKRILI